MITPKFTGYETGDERTRSTRLAAMVAVLAVVAVVLVGWVAARASGGLLAQPLAASSSTPSAPTAPGSQTPATTSGYSYDNPAPGVVCDDTGVCFKATPAPSAAVTYTHEDPAPGVICGTSCFKAPGPQDTMPTPVP